VMFLITSIAMLRERTTGTLERLLTTPLGKLDLLFGYGIAFGLAAAIQASVASSVAFWLLGMQTAGGVGQLAKLLRLPLSSVSRWLEGTEEAPEFVYRACIEIVLLHPDGAR